MNEPLPLVIDLHESHDRSDSLRLLVPEEESAGYMGRSVADAISAVLTHPATQGDDKLKTSLKTIVNQDPQYTIQTPESDLRTEYLYFYGRHQAILPRPEQSVDALVQQAVAQKERAISHLDLSIHPHKQAWKGFRLLPSNPFQNFEFEFLAGREQADEKAFFLFERFLDYVGTVVFNNCHVNHLLEKLETVFANPDAEDFEKQYRHVMIGAQPVMDFSAFQAEEQEWARSRDVMRQMDYISALAKHLGDDFEKRTKLFRKTDGSFHSKKARVRLDGVVSETALSSHHITSSTYNLETHYKFMQMMLLGSDSSIPWEIDCTRWPEQQQYLALMDHFLFSEALAEAAEIELDRDDTLLDDIADVTSETLMKQYVIYNDLLHRAVGAAIQNDRVNVGYLGRRAL